MYCWSSKADESPLSSPPPVAAWNPRPACPPPWSVIMAPANGDGEAWKNEADCNLGHVRKKPHRPCRCAMARRAGAPMRSRYYVVSRSTLLKNK